MLEIEPKQKLDEGREAEVELILACSQTRPDAVRVRRAANGTVPPLNWQFIFRVAGRNGILPLVGTNLLKICPELLSTEIRSELTTFLRDHIRNNLLLTHKVIEISDILKSTGIPMLPIKGPSLAIQAYGDIALRQYVDLDLVVQPRHFDQAVRVLQSHGYIPHHETTWLRRKVGYFTRTKDLGLVSEDRKVRIELHWKLSGSHFAMPVEIGKLWGRLSTANIGGKDLLSLGFNDLFVYLCLHGSRHGWEKFLWVCDINELIRKAEGARETVDWLELRQHARDHGCEKALELGLFLIYIFFDRRVKHPDIDRIMNDPAYKNIAAGVHANTFEQGNGSMEIRDWYAYHLSLKEKLLDRIRMRMVYLGWYLKVAVTPNQIDEAIFRLPATFYPLYYLFRPIRLMLSKRSANNS